jgi:hypothetical protein
MDKKESILEAVKNSDKKVYRYVYLIRKLYVEGDRVMAFNKRKK